jgi:hypothetical protein
VRPGVWRLYALPTRQLYREQRELIVGLQAPELPLTGEQEHQPQEGCHEDIGTEEADDHDNEEPHELATNATIR